MLGADGNDSPEEENADVLRRMANDGDDLTKARHHVAVVRVDELAGKRFTFFADPDGLPIELYEE